MVRVARGNLPGTLEGDARHGMLLPSSMGRARVSCCQPFFLTCSRPPASQPGGEGCAWCEWSEVTCQAPWRGMSGMECFYHLVWVELVPSLIL